MRAGGGDRSGGIVGPNGRPAPRIGVGEANTTARAEGLGADAAVLAGVASQGRPNRPHGDPHRHDPREGPALLELALVEAATNVVRHAYGGRGGRVEVELTREGGAISLSVLDSGASFDPTRVPPPRDPDPADPSTWPEGGMGLPIIRAACDELRYRVEDGRNRLTLHLRVDGPDAT